MRNHVLSVKLISCFQKHTVASSKIVALGLAETDWRTQMVCSRCVCLVKLYMYWQQMGFSSLLSNTHLSITLKLKAIKQLPQINLAGKTHTHIYIHPMYHVNFQSNKNRFLCRPNT